MFGDKLLGISVGLFFGGKRVGSRSLITSKNGVTLRGGVRAEILTARETVKKKTFVFEMGHVVICPLSPLLHAGLSYLAESCNS